MPMSQKCAYCDRPARWLCDFEGDGLACCLPMCAEHSHATTVAISNPAAPAQHRTIAANCCRAHAPKEEPKHA